MIKFGLSWKEVVEKMYPGGSYGNGSAIAGACYGIEEIAAEWRNGLENKDYIEKLGEELWRIKMEGTTEK